MISFYFALLWAQALSPFLVAATESEITSEQKYFQAQLGGLVAEKFVAEFDEASTNKVNADALVRKAPGDGNTPDGNAPGGPAAAQNDERNDEGAADILADDAAKTPDDDAAKTPDDGAKTPIGDPPRAGAESEAGGTPYAEVTTKITALNTMFEEYGKAHNSLEASAGASQKAADQYKKELEELAAMWTTWQSQAKAVEAAIKVLNEEADRNKAKTSAAEAAPAEDGEDAAAPETQPGQKSLLETQDQPDYETEQSLKAIKQKIDEAKRQRTSLSTTLADQQKIGKDQKTAAEAAKKALQENTVENDVKTNNAAPNPTAQGNEGKPPKKAGTGDNEPINLASGADLLQLSS
jgi:hypothetical protein